MPQGPLRETLHRFDIKQQQRNTYHRMNIDDLDLTLFSMDFSCRDILGGTLGEDPIDFVSEYEFKIKTYSDESGQKEELVGKGKLSLIHFSLAIDANFRLYDVMDSTASILDMSEKLFNWEQDRDPFEKLEEYFAGVPFLNSDICFVEEVEVLPAFRGQGIGKAALISIARKFYNSCGLIVARAFPLQHQSKGNRGHDDEWSKAMRYDELEQDFERSQYQLFHWYKQMGLNNPFDPEYFMIRPHELAHFTPFGEG